MIEKEDLAGVLQHACRNGDFAEIYMEKSAQNRVSMEAGKIERVISGSDRVSKGKWRSGCGGWLPGRSP
jgi:predicted Zn-dependent protease